jgi:integrating conjugative element membrane protein (TIGR03747 family)
MPFAEDHDMAQAFAPDAAQDAFTERVEVRRSRRDSDHLDTAGSGQRIELATVLAVVVPDEVTRTLVIRGSLTKLLSHPELGGVTGHVEVHVFWPYPGGPRGVELLRHTVLREAELIARLADDRSARFIHAIVTGTHTVCFVRTGVDELMTRFADPSPLPDTDEGMRRLFLAHWDALETAVLGLQLFSMRLGVVLLAAPLFVVVALGAIADGLVTWYRRRTAADRESAFIYHRAKRGLAVAMLGLGFVYLLPPVVRDPRYVISPFLVAGGLAARFVAAYFKKYL